MKSNYPNKLDTSVEIPQVRDNITEIGSDVINSLRSAIFQIEKTLGINPQGAAGNTLSNRLQKIMDEAGNLRKEAIDKAGILSGPITDQDVSKAAGIDESKLKLRFPTDLLQDEISIIDSKLNEFIQAINEINAILTAHVNSAALNRHFAKAITVEEALVTASDAAVMSLQTETLQLALERLYNAHINFTGVGIGSSNNSHSANQIYFDNQNISDISTSNNVQAVIEDIANLEGTALRRAILNISSNGIIRTGKVENANESNGKGEELVAVQAINYTVNTGLSKTIISFPSNPVLDKIPAKFDVLTIASSADEINNGDYLIESVSLSGSTLLSVTIFGGPKTILSNGTTGQITKNPYVAYNENSLNTTVRPRYLATNTPDIQVALPGSATIISSGAKPENINSTTNNILSLEVDGQSIQLDLYNADFSIQSIDSIVYKINKQCSQNKYNIFAYKIRSLKCYEIAISHVLPDLSDDLTKRSIKVISSSATSDIGMSYLIDRLAYGSTGNSFHLNGNIIGNFNKVITLTNSTLQLSPGSLNISNSNQNFSELGVREGHLCVISGAANSADDGTYRIGSVSDSIISLEYVGTNFAGQLTDTSQVFIVQSTASIGELDFVVGAEFLIDVFIDHNLDIHFTKRLKQSASLTVGNFYAVLSDISHNFITGNQSYTISVNTNGFATLSDGFSTGPAVYVSNSGRYKIFAPDLLSYVIITVYTNGVPASAKSAILSEGSEIPSDVLHLCRASYSPSLGMVLGTSGLGIPSVTDKRTTGTVDDTIVSEPFIQRYIEGPRNELRSSGIIRGLELESVAYNGDGTCTISITPGVAVVNGIRYEYFGVQNLIYRYSPALPLTENTFYIVFDEFGCIQISNEVQISGNPTSPFYDTNAAHICLISPDSISTTSIDLRLFIDKIDYKIISDITVSNDSRFGHFTDIKKAVDYIKKFRRMFPSFGTPTLMIKEGQYTISEKIVIDTDMTITGVGPSTVISRASGFYNIGTGDLTLNSSIIDNIPFVIGSETNTSSSTIVNGVTIKNLVIRSSAPGVASPIDQGVANTFFLIAQDLSTNADAVFRFENISFIGNTNLERGVVHEFAILLSRESGSTTNLNYGNLFVNNCYASFIGNETASFGAIINNDVSNYVENIIIDNFITKNVQPTYNASAYACFEIGTGTNLSTSNLVNINNVVLTSILDS
jgi:hypothetical protein